MPGLYIITGSNGAGKSSFGASYLPPDIRAQFEVFDGDKLFLQKRKELYPKLIPSLKEAKRVAGEWLIEAFQANVQQALDQHQSFVYEGHFVDEETWDIPRRFLAAGHVFHLVFLGLTDTDLSQLRVLDRAIHGGHNVPLIEIERNFYGNLHKLNEHFEMIDHLHIIDTSAALEPKLLCSLQNGRPVFHVSASELPGWFSNGLPNIVKELR